MPETHTIPSETGRVRADKALAVAFPAHSRMALQRAFDAGLVTRGGVVLSKSAEVHGGETLEFSMPEVKPSELKPADITLDVIFEDKHMLALNKPAGMVVHPGIGTSDDTLVHALLAHCAGQLSGVGGVERPGIVHRLDKDTTGVLVVAKNDVAHRALADQFASRTLRKEYVALVSGVPQLKSGTVDKAIARHPVHRHRMTVSESGRPSKTDWECVEVFDKVASLIRCRIHTGRTHQIRVHLKSLGHVILGDVIYGWKIDERLPVVPTRVMLHAEHLVLAHPVTGKVLDLRAPVPPDFAKQIAQLRKIAKAAAKGAPKKSGKKVEPPPFHVHESRT